MDFSVTILGISSAVPNSKRNPSSQVVNLHNNYFLVDCGEGTQIQLRRNHFKFSKINHIFISHLHGDHVFGLFGLLSTFSLLGRTNDLHIYANSRLKELIDYHNQFFNNNLTYQLIFHPLTDGESEIVLETDSYFVKAFPMKHSVPVHGFRFSEKQRPRKIDKNRIDEYKIPILEIENIKKGANFIKDDGEIIPNQQLTFDVPKPRSYAYCSDTAYNPLMINEIENLDLLFHESTFCTSDKERAKLTMHSTAEQAATIAKDAKVKSLLLGHFSTRYKDLSLLGKEAQAIFKNTQIAEEGKRYDIEECL